MQYSSATPWATAARHREPQQRAEEHGKPTRGADVLAKAKPETVAEEAMRVPDKTELAQVAERVAEEGTKLQWL